MRLFLLVFATFTALPAHAQSACPTPDRLTGPAKSFDDLTKSGAATALVKDEFETTAQFEARKAAVQGTPGETLLRVDVNPKVFAYDADAQRFTLSETVLSSYTSYSSTFGSKFLGATEESRATFGDYNYVFPVEMLVSRSEKVTGTYEAQNAYGAKTEVTKKDVAKQLVFDNKGAKMSGGSHTLFAIHPKFEVYNLSIPVPLDRAREVKDGLNVVALVSPYAPYFRTGSDSRSPTRDLPYEVNTSATLLFADIKCVAVRDAAGTVLAHWATR